MQVFIQATGNAWTKVLHYSYVLHEWLVRGLDGWY